MLLKCLYSYSSVNSYLCVVVFLIGTSILAHIIIFWTELRGRTHGKIVSNCSGELIHLFNKSFFSYFTLNFIPVQQHMDYDENDWILTSMLCESMTISVLVWRIALIACRVFLDDSWPKIRWNLYCLVVRNVVVSLIHLLHHQLVLWPVYERYVARILLPPSVGLQSSSYQSLYPISADIQNSLSNFAENSTKKII